MSLQHISATPPMSSTLPGHLPLSSACPTEDVSQLTNPTHTAGAPSSMPVVMSSPSSIPFSTSVVGSSQTVHHQQAPQQQEQQHQLQLQLQHQPSSILSTPVSPAVYSPMSPAAQSKWRVTPNQREILQAAFDINPYPELRRKEDLAVELGVTTTQVSKWFQHRRETLTRLGRFKAQYNRTRRTPAQLDVLQQSFQIDRYPSAERLAQLEAQLDGVTAKQIKLWFKHRRKQVHKRNRASTSNSTSPTARSNPHSPFRVDTSISQHHLSQSFPPTTPTLHHHFIHPTSTPTSVSIPLQSHSISQQPHSLSTAPPLPQSSIPQHQQSSPDTPSNYPLDPASYYGFKANSQLANPALPATCRPTFSSAEIMALRAASVVMDGKPTPQSLNRLSGVLSRSHADVSYWFDTLASAADSMGVVDGHMTDPVSHPFVGSPCLTQSDAPPLYTSSAPAAQDVSNSQPHLHIQAQINAQDHMQGISLGFPRQENTNASSSTNEPVPHHQSKEKQNNMLGTKRIDDGLVSGSEQQGGNSNNDGVVVIESGVGSSAGKNDSSEAEMPSASLVHHVDSSSQPQSQLHHINHDDVHEQQRETRDHTHGLSDSQITHPQTQHLVEHQQASQHHPHSQSQQPQAPPPSLSQQQTQQHQAQQQQQQQQEQHLQHLQHHSQPHAQGMHGMYGTIVYPDGMMMTAHPVGIPMEGQNSPTLAPLRHVGGSPIPAGYVTPSNVWYPQGPTYK